LEGERAIMRSQETNLGNLTADANLAYAKSVDPTVVISLKNGGGIRSQIGSIDATTGEKKPTAANPTAGKPEGGISTLDIEYSLRFNNSLSLVTVTASQLKAMLEHGVSSYPNQGRFPQVSGMAFSFDPSRPEGSRIINLTIEDATGRDLDVIVRNGEIYGDPTRTFRMVTLFFIAGGGDGYPTPTDPSANRVDLFNPEAPRTGAATFSGDGTEQDVLAEYLAATHGSRETAYNQADTPATLDLRMQNLAVRGDSVIDAASLTLTPLAADKAEGNIGSTAFTFTVNRSGDPSVPISVSWVVSPAGANPANALDFAGGTFPAGTVVLAAGQTSQTFTVNVIGDNTLENDETFSVSLTNPIGGVLGTGSSNIVGHIRNDDAPTPLSYAFSSSATTVEEGGVLNISATTNASPGSVLFWQFSGAGISSSDFNNGLLSGTSLIGLDGRAAFSTSLAADGVIDPNETLEVRFYTDAARTQQVGNTLSVTIQEPSVGLVTEGSDIITGTNASELINGVPSNSSTRGSGSLDRLTGGGGDDVFVLGNALGHFYDDGTPGLGTTDLALITDFGAGDRIQLHGSSSDYLLVSGRHNRIPGVRIDVLTLGSPEAIGFVQGATLASLNLANATQFTFV
ncbi:MAG: 5'-nucleotidase C-terminal domain-containing protein, partial [Cyanobacteriota bacterium]|nr:5'-nucleotidase C-terminal domain-containing protein [Cyanobacteriota bacterium]